MKQFTFLLLISISIGLFGQEKINEIASTDFVRSQIGINTSLDVGYRTLKNKDGSSIGNTILDFRNENEIPKIGFTTGMNILFNIKKNISVEAGIQYSNKGYQTKLYEANFITPDGGGEDPLLPDKLKYIYNYHYMDIPLKANLTFGKNKLRFISSLGLTTNVFIKETQTSIQVYSNRTERNTVPTNIEYKRFNLSPTISAGIDYKLNNRMNLRIEPTFRYGVLKIIDASVTGYLFNGGLNIGYYFGF